MWIKNWSEEYSSIVLQLHFFWRTCYIPLKLFNISTVLQMHESMRNQSQGQHETVGFSYHGHAQAQQHKRTTDVLQIQRIKHKCMKKITMLSCCAASRRLSLVSSMGCESMSTSIKVEQHRGLYGWETTSTNRTNNTLWGRRNTLPAAPLCADDIG
jgi:hypothetical protein